MFSLGNSQQKLLQHTNLKTHQFYTIKHKNLKKNTTSISGAQKHIQNITFSNEAANHLTLSARQRQLSSLGVRANNQILITRGALFAQTAKCQQQYNNATIYILQALRLILCLRYIYIFHYTHLRVRFYNIKDYICTRIAGNIRIVDSEYTKCTFFLTVFFFFFFEQTII